jgi:hypothetical protein
MDLKTYILGHLRHFVAIASLAVFAAGCGVGNSPMASTDEGAPAISQMDEAPAPAAKRAKDTTDDGSDVTKKKGDSRYSMPRGN